ncbi:MAG: hypothetical protein PHW19_00910 [Salinivirgaceae bacterium]|nr:hypothetical protein [Salinivirgaceae bacterium]
MKNNFFQYINIFTIVLLIASLSNIDHVQAQYEKEGYTFIQKLKTPRARKPEVHELMLDPHGRFLILTYSSHPTHILLYQLNSWNLHKEYMVPEWFDLSNSFVDPDGRYLFIDFGRFSSKYRRIDLTTDNIDTVECSKTPRGCIPKEASQTRTNLYTPDKSYYITVNRKNKRDVLIFKKENN